MDDRSADQFVGRPGGIQNFVGGFDSGDRQAGWVE